MKKLLAAVLALLMIVFLFCACKNEAEETATETGEQTTTAPPATTKTLVDGLDSRDEGWGLPGEEKWY